MLSSFYSISINLITSVTVELAISFTWTSLNLFNAYQEQKNVTSGHITWDTGTFSRHVDSSMEACHHRLGLQFCTVNSPVTRSLSNIINVNLILQYIIQYSNVQNKYQHSVKNNIALKFKLNSCH